MKISDVLTDVAKSLQDAGDALPKEAGVDAMVKMLIDLPTPSGRKEAFSLAAQQCNILVQAIPEYLERGTPVEGYYKEELDEIYTAATAWLEENVGGSAKAADPQE